MNPVFALEQTVLSHQHLMKKAIASGDTPVQNFYKGSVVFVTGSTGFLGKLLIEKLLRTCDPNKVYVLIRHKKDLAPKERLLSALKDPLFDELRKQRPNFEKKLCAVQGDVSEVKLGLCDSDWKILSQEVNVIFHIAANIRFDVELKTALLTNARGTREVLHLATDCVKLRAFVYVSTAYSHVRNDRINDCISESFYEAPASPDAIIQLAETIPAEKFKAIAPTLVRGWPNNYTYSKAIAEEVVRTRGINLPVCVIRPTIVSCTYRDPMPGWLDFSSAYGPSGMPFSVGIGLSRVIFMDEDVNLDLVPADFVTNSTIVAAWETSCKREHSDQLPKIYTVSSTRNPLLIRNMLQDFRNIMKTIAISNALWYCFFFVTKYKFMYNLMCFFLHYIPAYIVDGICVLFGKPPKLVTAYKKVDKIVNALAYFVLNQWTFEDTNTQNLFKNLSPTDKQIFEMDITNLDWHQKMHFWSMGMRIFLAKDTRKSCDYAFKKQKVLRWVHYVVSVLYLCLIWKFVKLCFDCFCIIL